MDSSLESEPEDVKNTLMDVLGLQEEPRGPFHLAVEGCLKFKASLASIKKHEPKLELDHQIRKVIYTSVIKHLEQNLSCFRNHKKLLARRNLQVANRSITTAPDVEIKANLPTQSQRGTKQEAPKSMGTANTPKYTIGWVCAIAIELAAVKAILDEEYEPLPLSSSETNIYTFGRIGKHNVVIACLPSGKYGKVSAATMASEMRWRFPGLRFYLMVGIGGGVPSDANDIRLGDVVVSLPAGASGGVIQYDFGKTISEGKFQHTGNLNAPPMLLLNSLTHLRAINTKKLGAVLEETISRVCKIDDRFNRPRQDEDRLFSASYEHPSHEKSCEGCDAAELVVRKPRGNQYPYVHYGIIASGDKVMKHAATRDRIGNETGAICFEMEAAGLIHSLPCLVVRGICDYSDSHKSKEWQPYAALTAAALAKKLLDHVPHLDVLHQHQCVHSYG
ncbi:hypothetical protein AA313_de0205810 [Arthrobotrys entomopaga]|nr:hypothetical protein AA313_de0205810 [Arthrobotrys entomopaga]